MYADFRHRMPLRVRWAEVDKQGVVFNAHYLLYCDVCVTEYWRAVGVQYPDDFVLKGSDLFVRKSTVEYLSAAYYDDELEVCGRIARLGNSSMRFVVEIYRRRQYEAVLITAELIYVLHRTGVTYAAADFARNARADSSVRDHRTRGWQRMRIELGDWESMRQWAEPLRFAVFVEEQQVPADIELDSFDRSICACGRFRCRAAKRSAPAACCLTGTSGAWPWRSRRAAAASVARCSSP